MNCRLIKGEKKSWSWEVPHQATVNRRRKEFLKGVRNVWQQHREPSKHCFCNKLVNSSHKSTICLGCCSFLVWRSLKSICRSHMDGERETSRALVDSDWSTGSPIMKSFFNNINLERLRCSVNLVCILLREFTLKMQTRGSDVGVKTQRGPEISSWRLFLWLCPDVLTC